MRLQRRRSHNHCDDVREVIHAKVHLQKASVEEEVFGCCMKEGMPLKAHLDELNSNLMGHQDIDIKIKHEDTRMILLASSHCPTRTW